MDNKSQIQFISPKDQELDESALKDKYGSLWKLIQRKGVVRDLRTETGLEDLRKDLTYLYDEILNIAQEGGIEITEVTPKDNIVVTSTEATYKISHLLGSGSFQEGDDTRREIGFLREGEATEEIMFFVQVQRPKSDTPFARAQVLERDMLKLNSLLDKPSQYRITDGVMQFDTPSTVSIKPGRNFSKIEPNLYGGATLIRKP